MARRGSGRGASTKSDIQPLGKTRVTGTGAGGKTLTLEGAGGWIDMGIARDGAAAAAGDKAAQERLVNRVNSELGGTHAAGGSTTVCLATDAAFAAGYDAIFGQKKKKEKKPEA